jgi:hypothetical protein
MIRKIKRSKKDFLKIFMIFVKIKPKIIIEIIK